MEWESGGQGEGGSEGVRGGEQKGGAGRWDGGSESREGGGKWYEGQAAPVSPGVPLLSLSGVNILSLLQRLSLTGLLGCNLIIFMFVSDLGSSRFQPVPVPG